MSLEADCHLTSKKGKYGTIKRYTAEFLLQSLRLAGCLHDRSRLSDTLHRCIEVLLPEGSMREGLLGVLARDATWKKGVPAVALNKWTVSRHQLTLDAAMMLAERARWQVAQSCSSSARWSWWLADSSPQGQDWLLIQSESMSKENALR